MRNGLKKWMLWITLVTAAGMLFVRLVAAPRGWLPATPDWDPALWTALLGGVVLLVVLILCRLCKSPATTIDHRQLASVSTVSILCGSAMLLCSVFEVGVFLKTGETPAPNTTVISGADGLLMALTWVCGILGGAFLAWLGFSWLTRYISYHGQHRLWALTPMLWGWMRLARYVVSYSSTVNVEKNISEFLMLIFTLLFFFAFARYVAAVGDESKTSPILLFYACGAFLFSATAAVIRLAGYWNRSLASSLPQMAGAADMAVGLLALAVAVAVAYTRRTETVFERVRSEHAEWLPAEEGVAPTAEEPTAAEPAPEPTSAPVMETETPAAVETKPDIDEILKEFYQDNHKSEE